MKGLELLKQHPKAAIVIKQWYLEKMLENINDKSIPDDFKDLVRQQQLDDQKVSTFIDASPRTLFDVFDSHKIYVEIFMKNSHFWWKIGENESTDGFENRKDAEMEAIIQAFDILNTKL